MGKGCVFQAVTKNINHILDNKQQQWGKASEGPKYDRKVHRENAAVGQNKVVKVRSAFPLSSMQKIREIGNPVGSKTAQAKNKGAHHEAYGVTDKRYTKKIQVRACYKKNQVHQHKHTVMDREKVQQESVRVFCQFEHGKNTYDKTFNPKTEKEIGCLPSAEKETEKGNATDQQKRDEAKHKTDGAHREG